MIRGIYHISEEQDVAWQRALSAFAYHVPRFHCIADVHSFMAKFCRRGSNPDRPHFQHIFTLLVNWDQLDRYLLQKMKQYGNFDLNLKLKLKSVLCRENRFRGTVVEGFLDRYFDLPLYSNRLSNESVTNTLRYLFNHMRCGIFVKICNNRVVMFVPFANEDFRNNWSHLLTFDSPDGTMESYYREKRRSYRHENIIPDKTMWWTNGHVIDNEMVRLGTPMGKSQVWGDYFLCPLREMLEAACKERNIPDCQFFINKRDYPQLKVDPAEEPYGFMFGKGVQEKCPLDRCVFKNHACVMSFYTSDEFADIPLPTTEDWESATQVFYPPSFMHWFDRNHRLMFEAKVRDLYTTSNLPHVPWNEKVPTAFFRGTASGAGTSVLTNQRLHLAYLSDRWAYDDVRKGLLDAALVGWNLRDKKPIHGPMTYVKKGDFSFPIGRSNYVPMQKQVGYKYLIYADGHSAASRYTFLMRLGCVIFKVDSISDASRLWYFPMLRPFVDHVPVKADLSNLQEMILWCREHDEECRQIAQNAQSFYHRYLSFGGILDYIELVMQKMVT